MGVALIGLLPIVNNLLLTFPVIADLKREIGMRMPIVQVPPLMLLIELDENLPVEPGLDRELRFIKTLKIKAFFVIFIERIFLEVLHEEANDFLGPLLHALDVKVHLSPELVL